MGTTWQEDAAQLRTEPTKLNTVYITPKELPESSGKYEITFYDSLEKVNKKAFDKNEQLFLLDKGYQLSGFITDEDCSLKSGVIFRETSKSIQLWKKGRHEQACSSFADAKTYIKDKAGNASFKQVLFLLSPTKGLFTLTTNGTIAIDSVGQLQRTNTHWATLEARLYDPEDKDITQKAHGFLSKVKKAMYFPYALISEGLKIEATPEEGANMKAFIEHYRAWKAEYIEKTNSQGTGRPPTVAELEGRFDAITGESDEDDLPF